MALVSLWAPAVHCIKVAQHPWLFVSKFSTLNEESKKRLLTIVGCKKFYRQGGYTAEIDQCTTTDLIIGIMLLITNMALAEMAVLYPINGAFYTYIVRFVDEAWGFICGWQYALSWLIVLPFELIAASKTIQFWRTDINMVRLA